MTARLASCLLLALAASGVRAQPVTPRSWSLWRGLQAPTCTDRVRNGNETDVDCGGGTCPACLTDRVCLANSDCLSGQCVTANSWSTTRRCLIPAACFNGVRDRRETDNDCGGGECYAACWQGQSCVQTWDCRNRNCTGGVCQPLSTCGNRVLDGTETDLDCGGRCDPCRTGARCTVNNDCFSFRCSSNRCTAPASCSNGLRDGNETDVDCGGADCDAKCIFRQLCRAGSDCQSGNCVSGRCASPLTCSNGLRDGNETDVDCGGADCDAKCSVRQACINGSDCQFGNCVSSRCASPLSCSNGLRDGNETDVDCGGPVCEVTCLLAQSCRLPLDCFTGVCSNGTCQEALTCNNTLRDSRESDVDCGGSVCQPCAFGRRCNENADCASRNCVAGMCASPLSCSNRARDGNETDTDCGGRDCSARCRFGASCRAASDCLGGICSSNKCQANATACANSVKDPLETDVDCGAVCSPCAFGRVCAANSDCQSNNCIDGRCASPASCSNVIRDGTETDVDCGGFCWKCRFAQACKAGPDCLSGVCTGDKCLQAATCSNAKRDRGETGVDCGGTCAPCGVGQPCNHPLDCLSVICQQGTCQPEPAPSCTDGKRNGRESDRDCGGPDCPPCKQAQTCFDTSDCASQECVW